MPKGAGLETTGLSRGIDRGAVRANPARTPAGFSIVKAIFGRGVLAVGWIEGQEAGQAAAQGRPWGAVAASLIAGPLASCGSSSPLSVRVHASSRARVPSASCLESVLHGIEL